jgi:superfamily II DNA or RNA helicase
MQHPIDASIVLRPYQAKALAHVLACKDRGLDRVLVVMPTGTGKTTLFSALIGQFNSEYKVKSLVLAHRRELLEQAQKRISQQNPSLKVGIEGAGSKLVDPYCAVVASVQSLGRENSARLSGFEPGCLIVDEAHHSAADSYQNVFKRFGAYEQRCFTVGVTATPHRMDNRPLHGDQEAIFQEVAFSYTLREAIADGWLADVRGYRVASGVNLSKIRLVHGDYSAKALQDAVNIESRNRTAIDSWQQKAADRKTIVFCTGVEHAQDVARMFKENGYAAEAVYGSMGREDRDGIMRRFASGKTQILTNVEIATEGFDVPDVGCVLLLRPTKSWALFCQMIGRGLRVLPNTIEGIPDVSARRESIKASAKADCIVIDVVDNGRRAPTMKEETVDPSLSAVIDLPPDLDLEGHSLLEAMGKWEKLDPRAQALLFRRNINFDELDSTLTAVDLISELTLPNEVVEYSRNAWMKVGDGRYMLACGSTSVESHKMALLECDALGFYDLTLSSDTRDPLTFPCGMDLMEAFKRADRTIKEVWPFTGGLTMSVAGWRKETVRKEQLDELRALGVDETALAMIDNAGQAWTLLELRKNSKAPTRSESLVM